MIKKILIILCGTIIFINGTIDDSKACECAPSISSAASKIASTIQTNYTMIIQSLQTTLGQHATAMNADTDKIVSAIENMRDQLYSKMEDVDQTQVERELDRRYGADSQPETNCGGNEMGGGYQNSRGIKDQASEDILEKITKRDEKFEKSVEYRNEIADQSFPEPIKLTEHMGTMKAPVTLT
ncbi:MAG: hypothetical protein LBT62_07360, partial [Deltaproteobacteria bacterium]|nr:hypothetical protein [Deltaproteobacteria bacterium]